jgi:TPR repeat protein
MSEWGIGAPADAEEHRQHWEELTSPAQELGTSSLLECARAGNVGAQMLLGIAYYTGIGAKADLEAARKYFGGVDPAVGRNSIGLIGSAAVAHATGQQHTADALLELATSRPIGFSEYSVGAAFYVGIIFRKDYTQAARWLRRAADKGDPRAQGTLGYMYALGRGVERDDHQAQYWLERQRSSAAPSYEDAKPIIEGYWEKGKVP